MVPKLKYPHGCVVLQLKTLVQSNPAALPMVLEHVGKASPQLLTVIYSVCVCVCV